uniref:Uncharacterized protein n=1 Tax=Photinus pyralis TaxID=7054 RepID=A0A1Y1L8P6_PHOPY
MIVLQVWRRRCLHVSISPAGLLELRDEPCTSESVHVCRICRYIPTCNQAPVGSLLIGPTWISQSRTASLYDYLNECVQLHEKVSPSDGLQGLHVILEALEVVNDASSLVGKECGGT